MITPGGGDLFPPPILLSKEVYQTLQVLQRFEMEVYSILTGVSLVKEAS